MDILANIGKVFTDAGYRGLMLSGFGNTLVLTLASAGIGLFLGFVVAVIKILAINNKAFAIPNALCVIYTTVFRGTPVALQLSLFVFAIFAIPGFKPAAAIICFGINSGAYVSESIRGGIMSVDKGQMEAGRSLGMGEIRTMVKIVLPQAIKNVIPAVGNEMIALLKETAIISIVGATVGTVTFDLTQAASTISFKIVDYFAPTLVAAMFYLIIVMVLTFIIRMIEKGFAKYDARGGKK